MKIPEDLQIDYMCGLLDDSPHMILKRKLIERIAALEAELVQATAENERLTDGRKHTQKWYAEHYGKLQDWARMVLPEPWRTQFFSCVANGLYDAVEDVGKPYRAVGGFMVTPGGYFQLPSAQEQVLFDQCVRAETAESERDTLRAQLEQMDKSFDNDPLRYSFMWDDEKASSGMFPFPSGEWVSWQDYCALRERLSRPVTDEEWSREFLYEYEDNEGSGLRTAVNSILAARTRQQEQNKPKE